MKALVLVLLIASQSVSSRDIHGRVVSNSGDSIRGVVVRSVPSSETRTDENGNFSLIKTGELVRFSAQGYRPVTRSAQDLLRNPETILVADPHSLWTPPDCSSPSDKQLMVGDWMQFKFPKGVRMRHGGDVDFNTNVICQGKACLFHAFGPTWSWGLPEADLLQTTQNMKERDVEFLPDKGIVGSEYRGRRKDGTLMRFVGVFGETISYDHAPQSTAAFFDNIIDSLCWRWRG
jgi:hypothetical protein